MLWCVCMTDNLLLTYYPVQQHIYSNCLAILLGLCPPVDQSQYNYPSKVVKIQYYYTQALQLVISTLTVNKTTTKRNTSLLIWRIYKRYSKSTSSMCYSKLMNNVCWSRMW